MLSTGANIHTIAAAEHDVTFGPPAHPHANSTDRTAPHTPALYRPPQLPPRTLAFNKGAQLPTAWSMASSLSNLDWTRPTAPRNSATPGHHLPAMATPSALQATTQHQAAWYEHISLAHSQERLANPVFISHYHTHSSLPPGGSRAWSFPPVITVPVPPTTVSLLPTAIGFSASAPPSGWWGVDASDQPPSDPSSSVPSATATSTSYSAST